MFNHLLSMESPVDFSRKEQGMRSFDTCVFVPEQAIEQTVELPWFKKPWHVDLIYWHYLDEGEKVPG